MVRSGKLNIQPYFPDIEALTDPHAYAAMEKQLHYY